MIMCRRAIFQLSTRIVIVVLVGAIGGIARCEGMPQMPARQVDSPKPKDREASLRAVLSHLGVGKGDALADIGAGRGVDTWIFAEIVGEAGTVFAEEIGEHSVNTLEEQAAKRGLSQVRAVLGRDDSPCLPANSADLAFVHHVYHHFTKPRDMLREIWRTLKPGGYLVVVDKRLGTLRDWVPRSIRGEEHHWIAETTVSREAREEGFAFVECAENRWHTNDDFVLVFQRPKEFDAPGRDPDAFDSLAVEKAMKAFSSPKRPWERPVFIALGEAREIIPGILKRCSGQGIEVVLEEWATRKDERAPLPKDISLPSILTDNGDLSLDAEPIDAVFFLDSYHLLLHAETLLGKLHEKLSVNGSIYVLDREAKTPLSRREASHGRKIQAETVIREMQEAGFALQSRGCKLAPDRFLLIFHKSRAHD